tara:strand:+ start:2298 stop:2642 length:345 start_codon:yes stop_codon:yes gene_type:complete
MLFLPDDIIINIINMLDFDYIIKLTRINKQINGLLDNLFFYNLAVNYYTYEFWKRAELRPKYFSKPLKNMKQELLRIERFQKLVKKLEKQRWNNEKFYNLWEIQYNIYCKYLKK